MTATGHQDAGAGRRPTKAQAELLAYLANGYVLGRLDGYHVLTVTDDRGRRWLKMGAIWPKTIAVSERYGWISRCVLTALGRAALASTEQREDRR